MTRVIVGVNSGVSRDDLIARNDLQGQSDVLIAAHAAVGTIDRWLEFAAGTVGAKPQAGIGPSAVAPWIFDSVIVASGYFWAENPPTSTEGIGVFGNNDDTPNQRYARIGQDLRPAMYDGRGNLKAKAASLVSTLTYTGVAFVWDSLNYPTVHLRIYVNSGAGWVQERQADSGLTRAAYFSNAGGIPTGLAMWGERLPAGASRGAKWRGIHLALSYSTTAFDAPHLTSWPVYMAAGCVAPTADGTYDEWNGGASTHPIGSGLRWQDVGATNDMKSPGSHSGTPGVPPYDGNDAGGSVIATGSTNGLRQSVKSSAANPLSGISSPVIHAVRMGFVGAASGSGKVGAHPLLRKGGVTVPTTDNETGWPTAGTAYGGGESGDMPRPGGGAWTVGDFDPNVLEWGGRNFTAGEASGLTVGAKYTALPGPWAIYSTETLPVGEPGQAGLETPSTYEGGKRPLFRPQYDHITGWRQGLGGLREILRTGQRIERSTRNRGHCGRSGTVVVRR